ncbi:MAG TPA: DUF2142 domain-containing protein [Thermoanaerobaculia bacterium]|nr:DUF2142 domain-containing protein [Thermoanaerobaculia bacterium]
MNRLVFAAAVVFGILFACWTPPFAVPDETGHWLHSVAIAHGESWAPKPIVTVPAWSRTFIDTYAPGANIAELSAKPRFTVAVTRDLLDVKLYNLSTYNAVGYLPSAAGVFLARGLRLSPLATFRAGRISSTLVSALLLLVALHVANGSRALLTLIALTPMAAALRASYSVDALLISLAILLAALLLSPRPRLRLALLAALLLVIIKPPYLPLALLACFASSSKRTRLGIAALLTLVAIAATLLARDVSKQTRIRFDAHVDPSAQLHHVAQHPREVSGVILHDLSSKSAQYARETIGVLGWLDIPLPRAVYWIFGVALLLAALVRRHDVAFPQSPLLLAIAITPFALALSVYVAWTPPGAAQLDGFQGRYLLPLLPFFALLPPIRKRDSETRAVALVLAFASVVLGIALQAVMRHYA